MGERAWLVGMICFFLFCFVLFFIFFFVKLGTPLHLAVFKGYEEIVKFLIEHGSNVDLQDKVFVFFSFFFDLFFHFYFVDVVYLLVILM